MASFVGGGSLTSCINVAITDDNTYEGPHSFSLSISNGTASIGDLSVGSPSQVEVEILDPEGMCCSWTIYLCVREKL